MWNKENEYKRNHRKSRPLIGYLCIMLIIVLDFFQIFIFLDCRTILYLHLFLFFLFPFILIRKKTIASNSSFMIWLLPIKPLLGPDLCRYGRPQTVFQKTRCTRSWWFESLGYWVLEWKASWIQIWNKRGWINWSLSFKFGYTIVQLFCKFASSSPKTQQIYICECAFV